MMRLEIDGQICSTTVTHSDDSSWCCVVERREKNSTGDDGVLFRANVEVFSISELIRQDEILRRKKQRSGED